LTREETRKSILLAIELIERAMDAHIASSKEKTELEVWKAASETEYTTFLLSRLRSGKDDSWKRDVGKIDRTGFGPALTAAQDLLREAERALASDLETAYEKTWEARGYLLAIQEAIEKEKTQELRARSQPPASA
jgi:hypothetical protein